MILIYGQNICEIVNAAKFKNLDLTHKPDVATVIKLYFKFYSEILITNY